MYKLVVLLFSVAMLVSSCHQGAKNTEKLIVASEQGDCVGVTPMKCLLVKKEGQKDWEFFYSNIEGFNYEPGYEYELEVRVEKIENPAVDQSSLKYTLVKEMSKEKKESKDLPQIIEEEDLIIESTE